MHQVLGSAASRNAADGAQGLRLDRDADRGLSATGATPAEVRSALERESSSGVEWLPRHAPHRRI